MNTSRFPKFQPISILTQKVEKISNRITECYYIVSEKLPIIWRPTKAILCLSYAIWSGIAFATTVLEPTTSIANFILIFVHKRHVKESWREFLTSSYRWRKIVTKWLIRSVDRHKNGLNGHYPF